jgi:hypothetical protein
LAKRRNQMESKIESALQPGHFIGWDHEASFVSVLRDAEHDNAALAGDDPMRAASLYETFIVACDLKAEEIDSEWELGDFVAGLVRMDSGASGSGRRS